MSKIAMELNEYEVRIIRAVNEWRSARIEELEAQLDTAWSIIANAGGGNWDLETPEWREAAARWRDQYHTRESAAIASEKRRSEG